MHNTTAMFSSFEAEKNRKAFLYTTIIVGVLLLIAFIWTWDLTQPPKQIADDLIEINLGNLQEGFGDVQPLIKGEKTPGDEPAAQPQQTPVASNNNAAENTQQEEDSKDEDATPINKPVKAVTKPNPAPTTQPVKNPTPVPAVVNEPKPAPKPKIAGYGGPKGGTGNGATEDNGYRMQGNNPNGKGDAGSPNGHPDSYGNTPGGRVAGGALRVSKGDRTIVNNYIFMGDLPKATINAVIKVNPDGRGTFVSFDKGTTSTDARYASAIRSYLPNIQFNKSDHESIVTVPFNFRVN